MPADALATSGVRALAEMVLAPKAGIFCLQRQRVNPVCNGIFCSNQVNAMLAADDLAPYITRTSTVMILTIRDRNTLLILEGEFPLPVPK